MWEQWLAQWTPAEIRTTFTYIGLPGMVTVGVLWIGIRHGWPWHRNKE